MNKRLFSPLCGILKIQFLVDMEPFLTSTVYIQYIQLVIFVLDKVSSAITWFSQITGLVYILTCFS